MRELREARGLTQRGLANASGVSLGAVRHFEQGSQQPGWPNVLALALALGVTPDAFAQEPANQPTPRRGRPRKQAAGQAPAGPEGAGPAKGPERTGQGADQPAVELAQEKAAGKKRRRK